MLEFIYLTLGRVLEVMLNGGEGSQSFGSADVKINCTTQKIKVGKEDCLLYQNAETKTLLSRRDKKLPRLNADAVNIDQVVNITSKVSLLITTNIMFNVL